MFKKLTTMALALALGLLLFGCETTGSGYGYHGYRDYGYYGDYDRHYQGQRDRGHEYDQRDRYRGYNYQERNDEGYGHRHDGYQRGDH